MRGVHPRDVEQDDQLTLLRRLSLQGSVSVRFTQIGETRQIIRKILLQKELAGLAYGAPVATPSAVTRWQRATASLTSWVRFSQPVLPNSALTCEFTVSTEREESFAIWAFEWPDVRWPS